MVTDSIPEIQTTQTWLATPDGHCQPLLEDDLSYSGQSYRLYRFLTELEDILAAMPDDVDRIRAIAPRVRRLLESSYWLQMEYTHPPADPGWSVRFLYREHGFALTVQMVAWLPGHVSTIHNHGTWGIVAVIGGQEKNTFWVRSPAEEAPDRIQTTGEQILVPGDIIGFLPDTIHCIEPIGDEPAVTFNLYGVTDHSKRFKFDPETHRAEHF
jgi:predicted metal-dependent enzyme (double-stranded beta helix superfamily)